MIGRAQGVDKFPRQPMPSRNRRAALADLGKEHLMRKLLFALLGLPLGASPLWGAGPLDNWPHWRGPQANGTAPRGNPPVKWDEKTNVKWKAALPGRGASTPIVWGDQVFVLTAIDTEKKAAAKDVPRPNPRFKKKTEPPTTYHQFVVLSYDRDTGK